MITNRWNLPARRVLPWPMRTVDTAVHTIRTDEKGRLVMQIAHADLPGLSPDDLCWWFTQIGGDVDVGGVRMSRYHAWHPDDHIHWSLARPGPNGVAEAGARFHIVEAFGQNMHHLVDVVEDVTRLDHTGITLEQRVLGQLASRLTHDFGVGAQGASYRSTLIVGFHAPVVCHALNAAIRRLVFPEAMGRAWIRHNIEEVGLLEHLVPLVRRQAQGSGVVA